MKTKTEVAKMIKDFTDGLSSEYHSLKLDSDVTEQVQLIDHDGFTIPFAVINGQSSQNYIVLIRGSLDSFVGLDVICHALAKSGSPAKIVPVFLEENWIDSSSDETLATPVVENYVIRNLIEKMRVRHPGIIFDLRVGFIPRNTRAEDVIGQPQFKAAYIEYLRKNNNAEFVFETSFHVMDSMTGPDMPTDTHNIFLNMDNPFIKEQNSLPTRIGPFSWLSVDDAIKYANENELEFLANETWPCTLDGTLEDYMNRNQAAYDWVAGMPLPPRCGTCLHCVAEGIEPNL